MNELTKLTLIIILSFAHSFCSATYKLDRLTSYPYDTRSDSIDLLHFTINLEITDFTNKIIKGYTEIQFTPLQNNIQDIRLDLMTLNVDSVIWVSDSTVLSYNHLGESLNIGFSNPQNIGDTNSIRIYYGGTPSFDPTFGGFYFQSGFAYNVGVSLNDIPHNYGRTWYPCFDNFIERSSYDFIITTQDIHSAVCGGVLQSSVNNGNGTKTYRWHLEQSVPSYLTSVAVNNFVLLQDTVLSISNDVIPIILAARPSDTANVMNSFVNLKNAFHIYESKFGPYLWDRIGYVFVPMTAGAMEHATNIAYPILLANGSLVYEDIMAHELSHHWFGNLITCRTAEDMWINEGSAVYCEYVFNEVLYGPASYRTLVRNAHKSLVHKAHIDDDDYWPLSGVPQTHTYGITTYTKGADMLHTMRSYLGDSLFFNGLTTLISQNLHTDINSEEYRDELSTITGYDLTDYFNTWVFQGGWPHFSIDSVKYAPNGPNYDVDVFIKQKLVGRTQYANQVPFTISFMDAQWNKYETLIHVSGNQDIIQLTIPFLPVFTALNLDEKISHAVTTELATIKNSGTYSFPHANFTLNVSGITDSILFLTEHNWAAADPNISIVSGITVSPQRYWKVSGIWNSSFSASATLGYNGRTTGSNSHLDHLLITGTEDSLVLLYRPGPGYEWEIHPDYTLNTGPNLNDKIGSVVVNNLSMGEYCFGYKNGLTSLNDLDDNLIKVFPNPTHHVWNITFQNELNYYTIIQLFDQNGKQVTSYETNSEILTINAHNLASGNYFLKMFQNGKFINSKKIIKSE